MGFHSKRHLRFTLKCTILFRKIRFFETLKGSKSKNLASTSEHGCNGVGTRQKTLPRLSYNVVSTVSRNLLKQPKVAPRTLLRTQPKLRLFFNVRIQPSTQQPKRSPCFTLSNSIVSKRIVRFSLRVLRRDNILVICPFQWFTKKRQHSG